MPFAPWFDLVLLALGGGSFKLGHMSVRKDPSLLEVVCCLKCALGRRRAFHGQEGAPFPRVPFPLSKGVLDAHSRGNERLQMHPSVKRKPFEPIPGLEASPKQADLSPLGQAAAIAPRVQI